MSRQVRRFGPCAVRAALGSHVASVLVSACALGALSLAMVACADAQTTGETPELAKVEGQGSDTAAVAVVEAPDDPEMVASEGGPELGAVVFGVPIYAKPDHRSAKIGYLRVGTRVPRGQKAANFSSCKEGFYNIRPFGFVCLSEGATLDMEHPLLKAGFRQADRTKPLPYNYAFLRAIAPRYYRIPTEDEQRQFEMALKTHMRSYQRLREVWTEYRVGANDVPIDATGRVLRPPALDPPALSEMERYGGTKDGEIPWFFHGSRKIPNVSSYKVPDFAVITNRVNRHGGVALIDAFEAEGRGFALTTDLRLIPTTKMLPGPGSTFHGVDLGHEWELPIAFIKEPAAAAFKRDENGRFLKFKERLAYGTPIQLTGRADTRGRWRFVHSEDGTWYRGRDLAIVSKPKELPYIGKKGVKWIDVEIHAQALVMYEGKKAVFATMVSTGKDGLGDPKKTLSTPRGTFRIGEKHVTHTMDSQVVGEEFELNDVPWVQYFSEGYALHAAYWHTEFGRPRSHGCINMSPIDAYRLFHWTEPKLPDRWHSVSASEQATGQGTYLNVHW